jgi:hypothetical protein
MFFAIFLSEISPKCLPSARWHIALNISNIFYQTFRKYESQMVVYSVHCFWPQKTCLFPFLQWFCDIFLSSHRYQRFRSGKQLTHDLYLPNQTQEPSRLTRTRVLPYFCILGSAIHWHSICSWKKTQVQTGNIGEWIFLNSVSSRGKHSSQINLLGLPTQPL